MHPMGSRSPNGKGTFEGTWRPIVTCLCKNTLCIVRLPPRANVPAQRTRRSNAFAAGVTRQRCGLLSDYFGHLLYFLILPDYEYTNHSTRQVRRSWGMAVYPHMPRASIADRRQSPPQKLTCVYRQYLPPRADSSVLGFWGS